LGHGITLGSVIWIPNDTTRPLRREGAGFRQVSFSTGAPVVEGSFSTFSDAEPLTFSPELEGELTEVRLLGNHIRGFASNGISVITVAGCQDQLVTLRRASIDKNTVVDNQQ